VSTTQRPLGRTDIQIHPVIMGTFAIGGWWWGPTHDEDAYQAIETALDKGANAIDTAPVYGFGHAEQLIGKAIANRRSDAVIMTKAGLRWDGEGTPFFKTRFGGKTLQISFDLRPESIRVECEASLQRLGVDEIDLYQCHWPDPATPIAETMGALAQLREEGKIRAIGVSNYSLEQIQEAQNALGDIPLASIQPRYSLLHRRIERDLLPHCKQHAIGVIGYRPMEQGLLTGKVGAERQFPEGDERATQSIFSMENRSAILDALTGLQDIQRNHDASSAQISVAWVLHQAGMTGAICGARNPTQAAENLASARIQLSNADQTRITEAFHGLPIRSKR